MPPIKEKAAGGNHAAVKKALSINPIVCNAKKQGSSFAEINLAALAVLPALLVRWLPDGRMCGREYVALNPRRPDRRAGSFRINVCSGLWADFATGDAGGDVISLAAYLFGLGQNEARQCLADMLGVRS